MDAKKRIRYAVSLLMATVMAGVAERTGEREILFPEMVALTIGLWIVDKRVWKVRGRQIVCLMTLGAVAGVCLVRYSPLPAPADFCVAFALAGGCLLISRTTLIPLLSACMLPVLLQTDSWVYPTAVCAMSFVVVAVRKGMERLGVRIRTDFVPADKPTGRDALRWLGMLGCVAGACLLAYGTGCPYLILPPLVVTFVEMACSKAGFRYRPVQVFLILTAAVTIGTAARFFGCIVLHLPQYAVALFVAAALFALFERMGKPFAPAGALAFIPMLVPAETLAWLPVQAAAGAALFIVLALTAFMRCDRWSRAQRIFCLMPFPARAYLGRPRRRMP